MSFHSTGCFLVKGVEVNFELSRCFFVLVGERGEVDVLEVLLKLEVDFLGRQTQMTSHWLLIRA